MARSKKLAVDSKFEKVRDQALDLDLDARAALVQILLESLEHLTEAENERLCLDVAEKRQRDVWEGRVKLVPGDEAKALLDRALS